MLSRCEHITRLEGTYELFLKEDGKIVEYRKAKNIVLVTGRQYTADGIFGLISPIFGFTSIAVGTDTTTPTINDTGLIAEIERKQGSVSRLGLIVTVSVNYGTTEANGALAEIGNVNGVGIFYNRATFTPLTKVNTQTLSVICKFLA